MTSVLLAKFNDAEAHALHNSVPHRITPAECRELTPLIEKARKSPEDTEAVLERVAKWATEGYVANYTSVRRIGKAVEKLTDGERTFTPLGLRTIDAEKLPNTTPETSADIEALIENVELKGLNQGFKPVAGKLVRLGHGCVVEGSVGHKGLQPNYVIDCDHPSLAPLLVKAREIGGSNLSFWDKIETIVELVRATLPRRAYEGRPYRRLMRIAREQKRNISLGDYIDHGAGVCREYALLTHLMLNEAGFNSFHAYMHATFKNGDNEEHAVAVVRHKGSLWVVDSFHQTFHGGKLRDFTSHRGNRRTDDYSAEVKKRLYGCRLQMNDFPTYWIPRS